MFLFRHGFGGMDETFVIFNEGTPTKMVEQEVVKVLDSTIAMRTFASDVGNWEWLQ